MAESHAPYNVSDHAFCPNCTSRADYSVDNRCRGPNETDAWGAEALCCGRQCEEPTCRTALWRDQTLMVQAGSGVCAETVSTRLSGVLCCKTKHKEQESTEHSGACLTSPTHVRSYVWAYVWPRA